MPSNDVAMARELRRHHLERMKRKMARMLRTWRVQRESWGVKSPPTPEDLGKLASTHGTHQCVMCRVEKVNVQKKCKESPMQKYSIVLTSKPSTERQALSSGCLCQERDCGQIHKSRGVTFFASIEESTFNAIMFDVHPNMPKDAQEKLLSERPYLIDCGNFSIYAYHKEANAAS